MTAPRKIAGYGWRRDSLDPRDLLYLPQPAGPLPDVVDLTPHMPPIYDQGQLGSCTGNGIARCLEYQAIVQGEPAVTPSRLFIYYNERVIEGTVASDAGAEIRDGIKAVASQGAPPESLWLYDITKFADEPPPAAYTAGLQHEALTYRSVQLDGPGMPIRSALAAGLPIVYGFNVPDYFENGWGDPASTPLPLPAANANFIGGHCNVLSGYDWTCKRFPVPVYCSENSWGPGWGDDGRFWLDSRWFTPSLQLTSDLWVVSRVT